MKVSLLQTHLMSALTKTTRVISSKAQLPILQNILMETHEEFLYIAGTNTETTVVTKTNAKIEKPGGVCVPAKLFMEFVSTLPEGQVDCVYKEGSLLITCGGYEATIPCVAREEFPPLPEITKGKEIEVPKTTLVSSLEEVLFAAAIDEGRPVLTGIKIKKTNEGVLMVATDGYRLSLKKVSVSLGEDTDVIIPSRALLEVVRIGQEEKKDDKMFFKKVDESQLGFFIGNTEVYTRLIDGEYPNFEKILPKQYTTRVTIQKELLVKATKSAALFARDNANIIKFHIEEGKVIVSANTPQVGKNTIELDAEVEGEGGDIAFNSRFVIDFLNHFGEDVVVFEMTGSLNPGVFKSPKQDDFLHIIMPVRTAA